MPKDFLLLKDFTLFSSSHKNGFILYDKVKQREHQFYAHSFDDYKQWYQSLIDLRIKLNASLQTTSSNTPTNAVSILSKSRQTSNGSSDELSRSLPVSLNFTNTNSNRKHQSNNTNANMMTLTTIMDSQDDINDTSLTNLDSPSLLFDINSSQINNKSVSARQQGSNGIILSSRENSPSTNSKVTRNLSNNRKASRDNSPVLVYR